MTLTPAQRRRLKSLAHHLEPLVQVGRKGITESLIGAVDEVLTNHELVKVRFMDFKDEKHALSDQIVERTGAGLVGIIGNVLTIYRPSTVEEKRRIVLPGV